MQNAKPRMQKCKMYSFHFAFCILGFAFFISPNDIDAVAVGSGLNESADGRG
jgi:hypothetical protein